MKIEDEDDYQDLRNDWLAHPFTQLLTEHVEKRERALRDKTLASILAADVQMGTLKLLRGGQRELEKLKEWIRNGK